MCPATRNLRCHDHGVPATDQNDENKCFNENKHNVSKNNNNGYNQLMAHMTMVPSAEHSGNMILNSFYNRYVLLGYNY